ncbi:MAG TPA: 2-oxo acid dehydrogenase subunit E2 [Candidatus Paceibacterota bacterium]|nr:2-oxo acid dehydrogenase subunit E2 [Verrucomicrobiota bacterium]HRY49621.1 2-oxo acid dehydrogenase subunit E2 [Candidatus Paceibacterota bacterium]HSA00098.1 2-oxo acid dehydrogenase subunit E2 [Candidatus Paceibacterota bacterium]
MDIKLPKLGEGADSGTVVSVMVKPGDTLARGQVILELENEKAVAPIPSPAEGKVTKVYVKEGDRISVGQPIAAVEPADHPSGAAPEPAPAAPAEAGGSLSETAPPSPVATADLPGPQEAAELETEPEAEAAEPGRQSLLAPPASPSIRKIARELGIDLSRIKGSEYGGRIVMKDLRTYIAKLQKQAAAATPAKSAPAPAKATPPKSIDFAQWGPITPQPVTALRGTISRRMSENWNSIPHVTQFDNADITGILALRKKFAPILEAQGARLTVTTFVLKALASLLQKHPIFNCSLDEAANQLVFKQYYHIGLAVDTEAGLIVPVIRDVDKKDFVQLSKDVQALAGKARERKIAAEELKGGTFTISNQGGIGGLHFTPIINKPEVAILGLGRGALQPVIRDQKVEPRTLLPLCLSYDHRVIDGGSAARFISDLVQVLENFSEQQIQLP